MLGTFTRVIEPLNRQLRKDLNVNTIYVKDQSEVQEVRVKVTFKTRHGKTVRMDNTQIRDCRALGLML